MKAFFLMSFLTLLSAPAFAKSNVYSCNDVQAPAGKDAVIATLTTKKSWTGLSYGLKIKFVDGRDDISYSPIPTLMVSDGGVTTLTSEVNDSAKKIELDGDLLNGAADQGIVSVAIKNHEEALFLQMSCVKKAI